MKRFWRTCALAWTALLFAIEARADVSVTLSGRSEIVFDTTRDGCTPDDMPDVNPRAYRDATGAIVMFALHASNHPLRGPDFDHLKIDCHQALGSPGDPDPAHYADLNFVTATWTSDGRTVAALVHHEYHADQFHRCRASGDLACWYNTIVAYMSTDGGLDFTRTTPLVVAAAPFRQDVEQGRHRGFFNPSNIVTDRKAFYALISTTGWTGQPFGSCLFRTSDPAKGGSWRAFDGHDFSIRYEDPYKVSNPRPKACATIDPFVSPVGSIVRHQTSGLWIATTQAHAGAAFPVDGLYYATSRDLLHWGAPRLLLPGKTLYNDLCGAGPSIINYPAMLDPKSASRNFDEVGDHPDLLFTTMTIANCATGRRLLVRQGLTIKETPR